MIRVLIIEDELPAREKLERYLFRYPKPVKVVAHLTTVSESVEWLQSNNSSIDLIFLDIQLADDNSFSIFDQVEVLTPIIFTTAFDEFAIKAFEVHSIAYLLKPINYSELEKALDKFKALEKSANENGPLSSLIQAIKKGGNFKSRFMVKIGEHIRSVTVSDIVLFYADGRNAFIFTTENRHLIIDQKMEVLENLLDPSVFFRANRSFIVHIEHIQDVLVYSNSRLKIILDKEFKREIIVSRDRVGDFKAWFDGRPAAG